MNERITRVLASNPGLMTGCGTNSYLLGRGDVVVVDPGPLSEDHLVALQARAEARGHLQVALVTHWHSDHLPLALELKRRFAVRIAGHASLPQVDRALSDGDRLEIGGVSILAVGTPGHTRDHLCYLVEGESVLFSGDHMAGEGTVVINPPDGDMAAYFASLRRVIELAPRRILPGHGSPIEQPVARAAEYLEHRLDRERQVVRELERGPRSVADLVRSIYAAVPAALHPVAARSVLAHLIKLEAELRVRHCEDRWQLA